MIYSALKIYGRVGFYDTISQQDQAISYYRKAISSFGIVKGVWVIVVDRDKFGGIRRVLLYNGDFDEFLTIEFSKSSWYMVLDVSVRRCLEDLKMLLSDVVDLDGVHNAVFSVGFWQLKPVEGKDGVVILSLRHTGEIQARETSFRDLYNLLDILFVRLVYKKGG